MSDLFNLPRVGEAVTESLLRDFKRALETCQYEFVQGGGILLSRAKAVIGGVFPFQLLRHEAVLRAEQEGDLEKAAWLRQWVREQGERVRAGFVEIASEVSPNLIPDAGLTYMLGSSMDSATTKKSAWYFGPFSTNWTPGASAVSNWAGAGSGPLATEFTTYDESNRQAWSRGTASAKSVTNSSATTLTISTGVSNATLYGLTLNSVATQNYNVTDQILAAASKFSVAKTGINAADVANLTYTLTASSS